MAERRTQRERTDATRAALVSTARELFGSNGYAAVGTERIASEAGVTRGALYHQFADKADLFAAVLDQVEADISELMVAAVSTMDGADTADILVAGADAFLDACAEPDIQRIVLIDGPSVLGWSLWREICLRHSVGLVAALLRDRMERGVIRPQPLDALTHVLVGAVDEAALFVALAPDPDRARHEVGEILRLLAESIAVG